MIIDLSGKRAVVTGSTLGIGFAIAKGLANAGASVVINGRSDASVQKAKARLIADVPKAKIEAVAGDLASAQGIDKFLAQVKDRHPGQQSRHLRTEALRGHPR
jgi:NAD(P)-dependent dehydrogenase (short-subunit alcohol dehydrogenase family)